MKNYGLIQILLSITYFIDNKQRKCESNLWEFATYSKSIKNTKLWPKTAQLKLYEIFIFCICTTSNMRNNQYEGFKSKWS